jgi:hypothetical protein
MTLKREGSTHNEGRPFSLSRPVQDYLTQFGLCAVFVTPAGRIGVASPTRLNRKAPAAVWWTADARTANAIITALGEVRPATIAQAEAEVRAAALRLNMTLADHSEVMGRTKLAVDKLASRLDAAQSAGLLKDFNTEFKRRRLEAQRRGRGFMPYNTARAKLAKLLAGAAAGTKPESLLAAVFEDSPSRKTNGSP